jgi:hypothetical protein
VTVHQITAAGGIAKLIVGLVETVRANPQMELREKAVAALRSLAVQQNATESASNPVLIAETGLPPLVELLKSGSTLAQTHAAATLAIVSRCSEAHPLAIAKLGGIEYLVGTMIELPRAALMADEIAEVGSFFSFGTNDLTQTTLGVSRDDAARFLTHYVDKGIYARDPFVSLDVEGVGQLIEIAVHKGRATRPDIKLGICGEHGGDPASITFCEKVGLDYVSASPYRVPIARLAAAQAALAGR